ncbi:hypothetical protein AWJ14_11630 [Hoeflea olei]|uniref:Autotransporter domain-containing protein n=1 Tax=Hoeflea olei TaxID=1480615 RepID=A0A1C1YQS5_9HYPH|nr:hypothetical protein AWJ14_11630 [Hoeflea olei]
MSGVTVINNNSITGGDGGSGRGDAAGGAGITGSGLTIVNSGTISGGLSSSGSTRANAIEFTSGTNTLELGNGSTITGNVVAGGSSDTLVFGGDTTPGTSFDAGEIGTKYTGFERLSKTGTSTWTLTGTNAHTGGTTVEAGSLRAGSAGAFAANTAYTVNGGTLDLNGHDLTMSSLSGSGGTVALGNAGLTVNQSGTTSYAGVISGTGSLTKSGAGTLTLTGANTYAGGTTISGGTLRIGDGGMSGSLVGDIVNNSALIFDRSDGLTYAGLISGTGSLTKSGAGTLTLTGANTYAGGTMVLAGTLEIGDGGTSGSLAGDIVNDAALVFNRSDALTYAGNMSGTGSLTKSGAGTLTLTGAGTHTGGTTISAGTLQIGNGGTSGSVTGDITNNSALIFNRSDALTYEGVISGTGSLTKSGTGTLTLTGTNTHTGGTTVSGGWLVVNGSIGAVTLNGGSLGGSGTIGGFTAGAGSTIAPGNSIGTLTVAGNADFAAGSTYAVEVDNAGNSDTLAATGTVTIDNGATLTILAENGTDDGSSYAPSTAYTIITAGTAVTGQFGTVTENFAFLDAAVGYGPKAVTLTLTRNASSFDTIGRTANQNAVARGLSSLSAGNAVYDAVLGLSAEGARTAFDSLSGEIHASVTASFIQAGRFARNAASNRIRDAFEGLSSAYGPAPAVIGDGDARHDGGAVIWGHGYGGWSEIRGNGNAAALDHSTGGFFFGADTDIASGWRGGLMAGYGNTSFAVESRSSSGDADSYTVGVYGGGQLGAVGLRLGASHALHDVSMSRTVTVGALGTVLSADYTASTTQLFGEAGYSFDTPLARFEPFAGFALVHQRSSGFTETGGAAALSVASTSQTLGVTTLGLRAERQVVAGESYSASLRGSLGWSHLVGDPEPSATMRFASGSAFTISGVPLDRDSLQMEAGLRLDFAGGAIVNLDYQGELSAGTQSHGVAARFSKSF